MKKAIISVVLLTSGIICSAQNLVVNPGFETWSKINKPAGWTTAQLCIKDSVNFMTGTYSCSQVCAVSSTKSIGQKISVAPGKDYILSFFFRTIVSGTEHGTRIWCHWEDETNKIISDPGSDDILQPSAYMKSEIWQQFSAVITSPAGAASFILEVRTYQNSTAFLDDFDFEETMATVNYEPSCPGPVIYPDPAHDYIFIKNIQHIEHISVLNLSGATVWSSEISAESVAVIPVSDLPRGMYIIKMLSSGKVITHKFIKH